MIDNDDKRHEEAGAFIFDGWGFVPQPQKQSEASDADEAKQECAVS